MRPLSGRSSGSRELKGCGWRNKNPGAKGLWTRKPVALSVAKKVRGQWGDQPPPRLQQGPSPSFPISPLLWQMTPPLGCPVVSSCR